MPVFAVLTVVVDVQDAERGEGGQEEDPGQPGAPHQAGTQALQGARHQVGTQECTGTRFLFPGVGGGSLEMVTRWGQLLLNPFIVYNIYVLPSCTDILSNMYIVQCTAVHS